jgi:hypothetical protein
MMDFEASGLPAGERDNTAQVRVDVRGGRCCD